MVKCFIVGATGEVGRCLLQQLAESKDYEEIVAITRSNLNYDGPGKEKIFNELVPEFDKLADHEASFKDCVVGFCTFGSTKAKAGSASAFEKIDYGYTMKTAELAKKNGCKLFSVVTAVGANVDSWFLYPRVKGMIERDLVTMDFSCLQIFRPGFLLCDRHERRPLEKLGMFFAKGVNWMLPGRIAVSTEQVAKAMNIEAKQCMLRPESAAPLLCVYENNQIHKLASESTEK